MKLHFISQFDSKINPYPTAKHCTNGLPLKETIYGDSKPR